MYVCVRAKMMRVSEGGGREMDRDRRKECSEMALRKSPPVLHVSAMVFASQAHNCFQNTTVSKHVTVAHCLLKYSSRTTVVQQRLYPYS